MLSKDGMHLLDRKRVNFPSDAKMRGPVALNEGQQTGHLGKQGLVGHSANFFMVRSRIGRK
jgi:hypothetical protein